MFLVTLIFLGVVSNNNSITISAAILLLMQQTALSQYIPFMEKHGLHFGIILLTIGVLSPLVSGKVQIPPLSEFVNFKMIAAVLIGILVAWLAGRGVPLMSEQPVLVTGLLIGTVIGVAFMGGIPVGPPLAAGGDEFAIGGGKRGAFVSCAEINNDSKNILMQTKAVYCVGSYLFGDSNNDLYLLFNLRIIRASLFL